MYDKICESFTEYAIKTINLKEKKLLTKDQQESYENPNIVHCTSHCTGRYRSAAHGICNLNSSVPKEFLQFSTMDLITCLLV